MKIGKIDYNVEAIKELGFEEFDKLYKDKIADTKATFEQITGEKVKEEKKEKEKVEFEVTKKPTPAKGK